MLWVTFDLDLPPDNAMIFVTDYKRRNAVREGREAASQELLRREGGPLGIRALREIVIAVADLPAAMDSWISFLGAGRMVSAGMFEFSEGPAVRLIQASDEGIRELVLEVASLTAATGYLESKDMLAHTIDGYATIAPSAVQGLTIRITELGGS